MNNQPIFPATGQNTANQPQNQQNAPQEPIPEVSHKSTKADIMKAYKEMLKRYEESVKSKKVDRAKKAADEQTVQKAGEYTVENITRSLQNLKLDLTRTVDSLAQRLANEAGKRENIQKAIAIQENKLKELYDIETKAASLEELIKAQEAQKESFAEEYEKMKLDRKREQDEYEYNLKQRRKKDEDLYREREEALKKREEEIKNKEQEFINLQKEAESFPERLEKKIQETKEQTAAKVRREMQIQHDLAAKEAEGERKVMEERILHLEEIINRQNEQTESLKIKLDQAQRQVQSIAEKSLESSSGKQTLKAVSDIAMQQARGRTSEGE